MKRSWRRLRPTHRPATRRTPEPPAENPTIYLCLSARSQPADAPPDHDNYFLLVNAPAETESIDWASALTHLNQAELTPGAVDETLGVLLKYQDDIAKIKGAEAARLVAEAKATAAD